MDAVLFRKLQEGRKRYQEKRTKARIKLEKDLFERGRAKIGILSKRELFIAGVSLYWAEGFKHKDESGLGLATLDPKMACFYINWLERCFGISKVELSLRITANIAHIHRIDQMQKFWAEKLDVSEAQFSKPFYQNVKQIRYYANSDSYFGVIRIRVRKSLNLLREVRGMMAGMRLEC